MILLDTDILSISQHPQDPAAVSLRRRIAQVPADVDVATTIISYEEQTRGWFAILAKARSSVQRIEAYKRLLRHLENWRKINAAPFDGAAEDRYLSLQSLRLRVGKSDLRIAAICLVHDALLISRNLADFRQIPGLRVEDWTRP